MFKVREDTIHTLTLFPTFEHVRSRDVADLVAALPAVVSYERVLLSDEPPVRLLLCSTHSVESELYDGKQSFEPEINRDDSRQEESNWSESQRGLRKGEVSVVITMKRVMIADRRREMEKKEATRSEWN